MKKELLVADPLSQIHFNELASVLLGLLHTVGDLKHFFNKVDTYVKVLYALEKNPWTE